MEIYEVVRRIFRYLPIRSVQSSSSVCRLWAEAGENTERCRSTVETFVYSSNAEEENQLERFDALISSMINEELWSIPSFVFVVATRSLDDRGFSSSSSSSSDDAEPKRKSQRTTTNIAEALRKHLNRSARLLTIVARGILQNDRQFESGKNEFSLRHVAFSSLQATRWRRFFFRIFRRTFAEFFRLNSTDNARFPR